MKFGCTGSIGPGYYTPKQMLRIMKIRGGVIGGQVGETFIIDSEIPGPARYSLPDQMNK